MTLNFPNESRSYDAKANLVRFWGYDRVMEVVFLVEAGALRKLDPETPNEEAGYLDAFDAARERIHETARRTYSRARKGTYTHVLAAADF